MPKDGARIQNNRTVTVGPCQPSDYPSPANSGYPTKFRSILQANAQARLAEKDMEHAHHMGQPVQFDMKVYETRHRYSKHVASPGAATHKKTCDDIV